MSSEPSHIPLWNGHQKIWNGLGKNRNPNDIEIMIAENRPKQILEYYDEAVKHTVRVFEKRFGCSVRI